MADEEILETNEEEESSGDDSGKQRGFLGSILPKVLKYLVIVIVMLVFFITVAVVVWNILGGTQTQPTIIYQPPTEVGSIDVLSWYALGEIRTRTIDETPQMVTIDIKVGYELNNVAVQTDLIARTEQIVDYVRHYLSQKSVDELTPALENVVKQELRVGINRILSAGQVDQVIFLSFNIFPF